MNRVKDRAREQGKQPAVAAPDAAREMKPLEDAAAYIQEYAKQKPETVALACIGLGFVLGWKLKLW